MFLTGTVYLYLRKYRKNNSNSTTNNTEKALCGHLATTHVEFEKFEKKFSFDQLKPKGRYHFCTECWKSKIIRCAICGNVIGFDEHVCLVISPIKFDESKGSFVHSKKPDVYVACSKHADSFFDIQGAWTQNGVNILFKVFGEPQGKNTFWKWKEVGFEPVESDEYKKYKNKVEKNDQFIKLGSST